MRHSLIAFILLSLLITPARAQSGPQLTQSSVAGGGGVSTQGSLRVEGVIGQSSAGSSSGGSFTLHGGFHAPVAEPPVPSVARANDARVTEPAAGTTPLLFTITLNAPATNPLTVNYATADGGANPATGGVACGGAVDYESANGTLNFAAGERVKTVSVGVCADTSAVESAETLLLNLSGASGGNIERAQANGTILQGTAVSAVLISELRTSGPNGAGDDFVELYNSSDFDQDISGFGVFKMGASCADTPVLVGIVPGAVGSNTTVLQGHGHYLIVGSQYSLGGHAAGDLLMTSDIESDRNVAVFSTADVGNLSSITRYDAVGFGTNTGGVCELFREGNTLAPVSGSTLEHTFFRKQCDFVGAVGCTSGGNPKDSDNNAADFLFADTLGSAVSGVTQRLGAPGPENRTSPVRRDISGVFATLLDSTKSSSVEPNRHRDFTSVPNGSFGTLSIRRRVTNVTGQPVTRLRVRIIEMTTFPVGAPGDADMRAISSSAVSVMSINDAGTCSPAAAPCALTVQGTTLETPPAQDVGGGYNSTLAAETVTLATPLAHNAAVNLQFVLGIEQPGKFRFYIIVEALP